MAGRSHWWTERRLGSPLFLSLSFCFSDYLPTYLPFCEAILRDLLISPSWQHHKRSKSARLLQFFNLTTSKTKQFCETSLKMESWVQSKQLRTNAFCHFSNPPVESTAPATKKWCQVKRSAAPVTQNHLSKPEDLMLQNATPLRKSAPSPPNSSDEDLSCTAPATENASLQILFKFPTPAACHRFWKCYIKPSHFAHFWQGAQSLAPATRKHIWTSKSAPYPSMFSTFDFEMCFAPQRRALFRHLNFQKWREHVVFCTFWLRNVLRATTACTFSTSQLPKVVRMWCFVHFHFDMCFAPQRRALFRHLNFQKWSDPGVFCTFWLGHVLQPRALFYFSSGQLASHPPL